MMALKQNLAHFKNSWSLKILKYKDYVNKSRAMSGDHFAKNRRSLANWWPV